VPLVATAHNYVGDRDLRPYVGFFQYVHYRSDLAWFARWTVDRADAVVAVSHFVAHMLRNDLGVTGRIQVIYNGVDTARFVPSRQVRRSGPFRVLFCGNHRRRKRPQLLVPLARALGPSFEIWYTQGLAGLEQALDAGGGAAKLVSVGGVPHGDMPWLYGQVDLLFMPSAREGFGLCVAEAMACGVPIVAADAGALPELVEEGDGGHLCPIDDVSAFSSAIQRIADDQGLAARMGEFNRERATARFSLEAMVAAYTDVFEMAMSPADRQ
jgi:glycosyltransferase involved in cell wall biosynthesis